MRWQVRRKETQVYRLKFHNLAVSVLCFTRKCKAQFSFLWLSNWARVGEHRKRIFLWSWELTLNEDSSFKKKKGLVYLCIIFLPRCSSCRLLHFFNSSNYALSPDQCKGETEGVCYEKSSCDQVSFFSTVPLSFPLSHFHLIECYKIKWNCSRMILS